MSDKQDMIHTIILALMGVAVMGLVVFVVWTGFDFYTTGLGERTHHQDYRLYRPAGWIGHGLGLLGTAMILLMLLYSLRKRVKFMQRWGHVKIWLRYHIFLGVFGPLLIILHTSFKIGGLVSISFWSMTAVALSGVFGRYLYQQIPRNVLGEALGSDEIERRNEEILVTLSQQYGLDQDALESLENLAMGALARRPALAALLILPWVNGFLARRLQKWREEFAPELPSGALQMTRKWVLQARRLLLFNQVRDLFHWWHVFHKPFAVIMIIVMLIHVAVALALGQTWTFSGAGD